ncbi:unnamed protein product [Ranitomeya imitator]|uniref:G-protein coupled receptors family 1 profile domain-containing protein n=1 Tax=Ranitomeya imitator TaxID=111125 RepID=A0ABN9MQN8_9NEOB|nr:unnamed protein product [Ranitomeya imitator]
MMTLKTEKQKNKKLQNKKLKNIKHKTKNLSKRYYLNYKQKKTKQCMGNEPTRKERVYFNFDILVPLTCIGIGYQYRRYLIFFEYRPIQSDTDTFGYRKRCALLSSCTGCERRPAGKQSGDVTALLSGRCAHSQCRRRADHSAGGQTAVVNMNKCDNATILEFHILAFSTSGDMTYTLFWGFSFTYLLSVLGNLLIVSLVFARPQLHTPMYFFLCNLSAVDTTFISTIFPNLLSITFTENTKISFPGCITQLYFFIFCVDEEILILTCMAYDRYVAVCSPLHYSLLMSQKMCIIMAACSLLISTLNSLMLTLLAFSLSFCSSSEINHFFCEIRAIMSISNSDTMSREMVLFIEDICFVFFTFLLIMFSYLHIISSVLKICSLKGRFKTFSSCSSHLASVVVFYGPILFLYMKSASDRSSDDDKFISLLYVAAAPMLNPIVYSLRNKEVIAAIRKVFNIKWNRF